MLGFFPDPYPDELLYSSCARYATITSYLNKQSVVTELFGKRGLSAIVDFPTRLEYFVSNLPYGHDYSVEKLINENTLFPYHQPFLPVERAKLVRQEMKQIDDNKLQMRIGTRNKQIENPSYFRYCSDCVIEDREKYKRTYWHRIHQLAGISVCPFHNCFLKNSCIRLGRISSSYFHDAESSLPIKLPKSIRLDYRKQSHNILNKIACDARWLLSNSVTEIGSEVVQNRYFNSLLKQGYAYYNGRLKREKLLQAMEKVFPPEVFKIIGKVSNKRNWLIILTQIGSIDTTYHPVRHLLLLTFLGISAKDFFEEFVEYKPFGNPPYPCLNLAANHYKELTIKECKILDNISKDKKTQGIPIGIFYCDCGFTYQRLGPDKSIDDKFSYTSVKEYGATWEKKFTELWTDLTVSGCQIGRSLGISSTSVGRQAIRLNLPMNTEATRSLQGYKRHRNPNKSFSELLEQYRSDWLDIRRKHRNLSRKQLLNKANFLYLWLKKNDSEWFKYKIPPRITKRNRRELLDWNEIDEKISKEIEILCKEILSSNEFPVRVCITEIIKRVGYKVWIDKRDKKLPETSQIIDKYLETLEDFMLRKVEWICKKFIEEKKLPSINQFKSRATLNNKTSNNSERIQRAIKKSLIQIKNSVNLS